MGMKIEWLKVKAVFDDLKKARVGLKVCEEVWAVRVRRGRQVGLKVCEARGIGVSRDGWDAQGGVVAAGGGGPWREGGEV